MRLHLLGDLQVPAAEICSLVLLAAWSSLHSDQESASLLPPTAESPPQWMDELQEWVRYLAWILSLDT